MEEEEGNSMEVEEKAWWEEGERAWWVKVGAKPMEWGMIEMVVVGTVEMGRELQGRELERARAPALERVGKCRVEKEQDWVGLSPVERG